MSLSDTFFTMTRDINGFNGFGLPFTVNAISGVLVATVAQSITVPSSYPNWIAVFSYTPGTEVWVDNITTALAPAGAFSATTSELNPSARAVKAGSTISFITNDASSPVVSVLFYVASPYGN